MESNKRIEQLEAKTAAQEAMIAHYEKKLGIGVEMPIEIRGYLAYQQLLEQQIKHIEGFTITSDIIKGKKSEDAQYERTEEMHSKLPDKISSLNKLRAELKIDFDPTEGKPRMTATTPQSLMQLK